MSALSPVQDLIVVDDKELLRLYVSYDIIQLSEDQFDDFILFINVDVNFFKTATEFELVTFIFL
mgnify:CR=1 FL=1